MANEDGDDGEVGAGETIEPASEDAAMGVVVLFIIVDNDEDTAGAIAVNIY